jgi:UPF0755 protein
MNVSKYCADPQKKGAREQQTEAEKSRQARRPKRRPNRIVFISFLVVLVTIILVGLALIIPMLNKGARHTVIIKIPVNATSKQVEDSVSKYLGSDYAHDLRQAMEITGAGAPIRYGAFRIEKGQSPMQGARTITHGGQVGIRVVIQNERDKKTLAKKFAAKLDMPVDSLMGVLNDSAFLEKCDTDPEHVMCLFLANTYEFFWTASPEEIVHKMRRNYDAFWTPERLARAEKLHLSPREVAILASIVDEETNMNNEKGIIGRLYINRLNKNMKLQADPTVRFALGDFNIKRITGEMTKTDSPFNTYRYEGLPPGPIRTTSAATMDAILSSRPNNYLYMCAKEDFSGYHNFAETYEEHLANAKRYQAALDKAGIR